MTNFLIILAQLPSPTPVVHHRIPREWLIAAAVVAVIGLALLVRGSLRAWHASNLFDRRYRFPATPAVRPRFGGGKCGGRMATVRFGSRRKDA